MARVSVLLLLVLVAGCASWQQSYPYPPEDAPPPVTTRVQVPANPIGSPAQTVVKPATADSSAGAVGSITRVSAKEAAPSGGDPGVQQASIPSIPLHEAVRFALQNNPRLRSAQASVESARGAETAAFAPFLPQVDLLTRYVATNKAILPGAPGPTGAVNPLQIGDYSMWQGELQLQWILYDFGRTAGRYGQASMREKVFRLQALRMEETVTYDVAAAYLQAQEALAFRRIAEETVRRAEVVLEDVSARKQGGVALKDDVLRGQVELSEARDALVRANDVEITALARLNNAMGEDASLLLRPGEALSRGRFNASLADCLQRAATQRKEVGVARDRVAVAEFGRVAAKGEFLPSLAMKSSFGRIDGENVVGGWSEGIGIQLSVPLYRGGANRGNLAAADGDISKAAADAQGVLNDISLEVTVAHRGVVSAQKRVELARPAVEQSAEALRIVRQRYRAGTATPTDAIDAETANTRADQRYVSARIDYLSALAQLAYVMGDNPEDMCQPLIVPAEEGQAHDQLPMPRPVQSRPGP